MPEVVYRSEVRIGDVQSGTADWKPLFLGPTGLGEDAPGRGDGREPGRRRARCDQDRLRGVSAQP